MIEVDEILSVLRPFAEMDREDTERLKIDMDELACSRGIASDMTIITSNDFRKAKELYYRMQEECVVDNKPRDEFTKNYIKSMNL